MYLNAYVPKLTPEAGVAGFVRGYLGHCFASTKAVAQMTESFVESIMEFALDHQIDLVRFPKGQRKDDVMQRRLRAFKKEHQEGVVFRQLKAHGRRLFVDRIRPIHAEPRWQRYTSVEQVRLCYPADNSLQQWRLPVLLMSGASPTIGRLSWPLSLCCTRLDRQTASSKNVGCSCQ
jgi:hypothetical protein